MNSIIPENVDKPKFFDTIQYSYLTQMGSRAYGTENENSDYDFYGFIVPPIELIFPHIAGHISGFGRRYTPFEQYQIQHVPHNLYGEVDITIYNIVKYFQLVMEGNPNMVDSLFTNDNEVMFSDGVGRHVKNNRHLFLSEKMFHTFRGMAYSHMSRLKSGNAKEGRKTNVLKYGYDTKDAYHTIRILLQIEQVLSTGDLDLKCNKDYLRSIRNGEYGLETIYQVGDSLLERIQRIVEEGKSVVPYAPDELRIRNLLIECIEMKYGNLNTIGFGK